MLVCASLVLSERLNSAVHARRVRTAKTTRTTVLRRGAVDNALTEAVDCGVPRKSE